MKITKEYLRRVIKEELSRALNEAGERPTQVALLHLLNSIKDINEPLAVKIIKDPRVKGKLMDTFHLIPTDPTKTTFNLVDPQNPNDPIAQIKKADMSASVVIA